MSADYVVRRDGCIAQIVGNYRYNPQRDDIVPPGAAATFTFNVKGARPGSFVIPLRGVVDGGPWMDDIGMYTVVNLKPVRLSTSLLAS